MMQNLIDRMKRLAEYRRSQSPRERIDKDRDGFIGALVGDQKERYRTENGGYDMNQALIDTAADDWEDQEVDNYGI